MILSIHICADATISLRDGSVQVDEDVAAGNVELCVVLSTSASSVECELTVTVGTVQNTAGMCRNNSITPVMLQLPTPCHCSG